MVAISFTILTFIFDHPPLKIISKYVYVDKSAAHLAQQWHREEGSIRHLAQQQLSIDLEGGATTRQHMEATAASHFRHIAQHRYELRKAQLGLRRFSTARRYLRVNTSSDEAMEALYGCIWTGRSADHGTQDRTTSRIVSRLHCSPCLISCRRSHGQHQHLDGLADGDGSWWWAWQSNEEHIGGWSVACHPQSTL